MKPWCVFIVLVTAGNVPAEFRAPASTAYLDLNPNGTKVSEQSGITGWKDPALRVSVVREINTPGKLSCAVALRLPAGAFPDCGSPWAASRTKPKCQARAKRKSCGEQFGFYQVKQAGYQQFTLEGLNSTGSPQGDLSALILDGTATADAHFNLRPRRNAATCI